MGYEKKGIAFFEKIYKRFKRSDLDKVVKKEPVVRRKCGKIGEMAKDALVIFQMIKDYCAGRYQMSLAAILFLGAAIAYLILPFDAIPDIIPMIGYLDDIGVLSLALRYYKNELSLYCEWRASQGTN